jgi:hypothetical protein
MKLQRIDKYSTLLGYFLELLSGEKKQSAIEKRAVPLDGELPLI